ncbi:C4-dicarboxylate ABC transporter permease [Alkalilimnicola ehrlichii]|uniref:C4-dicarboxylate ABC transporter permease n=1 Tax=Alkalilimnicola ehrlichii TaxID=351052 RepID=A0A3E0WY17_9GAMM|nr:TRAP transporter permease [Alkalilimnicola ehrlichii]RFA29280.1 C4-dicarboxylate ABC transporter permease [Alkalilimnicola ehrlichii]RFA36797.1 C4-dicarboxylate ABC transporter permease [Alkalilimnicola ehrlichii]
MSTHASGANGSPAPDAIPLASNERELVGWRGWLLFGFCVLYTGLHLYSLNIAPIETWTFRILHISGGLVIGYCMTAAAELDRDREHPAWTGSQLVAMVPALASIGYAAGCIAYAWYLRETGAAGAPPDWVFEHMRWAALIAILIALGASWFWRGPSRSVFWADLVLAVGAIVVAAYLIFVLPRWRMAAGTSFAGQTELIMAAVGALLILELTRRVAGMALVVITAIFIAYAFTGPYLPGILEHRGYSMSRFFTYIYTDNGVLGPTTAVSSTYIILFITFAAFLQASRVGDYFVNFAFSLAGRRRGGPAKVAVFASGLMGMINGTSAGNVVSTGSLTIPLMKRVGYNPRSAASIEASASTGGQIVPPIMGAGAFIMAEITGIPYTDIAIAALIPGLLYFLSIYFMVDLEARKEGMRGMSAEELPDRREMLRKIFLFIPIVMLVATLFMGYSVIRAGTMAMVSAAVVSWFTPHRMGVRELLNALALGARMAIPLVAVCACAGIIVGVISLTGVGARFAAMLLTIADNSQLLALFFAMCISILLGMGMPTTAAYAVAASVVAPGLQQMGIPPLVAHFFVFYYAVVSAITPPVALASYAAAAIAGSDPMRTSMTSFKFGLAAFIVPFMFFYSPALLMDGSWLQIARVTATASIGIYLLAAAIQGWFFGRVPQPSRFLLLSAAVLMIAGGLVTDSVGMLLAAAVFAHQRRFVLSAIVGDQVKGEAR